VNVPQARQVAVVDRSAMRVIATWPVTAARANYPMALDEKGRRLFVGCREPATLLVLDTSSGRVTGSTPICGDTDDLFYDERRSRVYVSCGDGAVDVIDAGSGALTRIARVPTAPGARTSLFVPAQDRLYVAAPRRTTEAKVLVYVGGGD
jgi:DNA-binding beta-propeller fold protein YncE